MSLFCISRLCCNAIKPAQTRSFVLSASKAAESDWVPQEKETHTGQKWNPNDYRLSRFVDRPKHVNPNFSMKLISEVEPKQEKDRVVYCDGGSGPTGHPRVYINLDKPGNHTCGYCGLRFYKDDHH
ncbi:probable NADH dehydrogenase [ubiquinone] iron-sulfur protein 6, mitochondrial [Anthonomus grandis grandis]|uniref:probable NADH dehydrogenase [ubiquinone] iron-sulfur protein 6, mitochondrial n=1 Tax=Anthonomus grandis grandis TaxID=2921223 RepID=UPI00216635C6|nr:probable NADH dehydrogenase [ubiquinone] iron-sulfur protein 6, mitochondrial [Anthonomus grandis grandis]